MRSLSKALAIAAFAASSVALVTGPASAQAIVGTSTAQAATAAPHDGGPQDCPGKSSAFDTYGDFVVLDHYLGTGHAHVHLSAGGANHGSNVMWARVTNAPAGTSVWLDWSDDDNNPPHNHHQCGYWTVDGSQGPHDRWTWAIPEFDHQYFRACGQAPGQAIYCTGWHD
ncbi:hypothetical protein [Kitasatospora kifunensis]|uniref:Secreted protein n=1 Tax=Kitasatospora kifunensis TaxID=58351 RepID=A0A7W7R6M9_KITKI|nr:hypothetical protein [Kitasatospora kifunensis]MBB4926402.1 hypothetical protein [Kitasatospora kifunensis]